jgi:hypothetical protein
MGILELFLFVRYWLITRGREIARHPPRTFG